LFDVIPHVLVQFDLRKKSSLVLNSLIKPERTSHTFCFENILPEADVFVSYNYLLTFLLSPSREKKEPNVLKVRQSISTFSNSSMVSITNIKNVVNLKN
jgi:hypothetical protein